LYGVAHARPRGIIWPFWFVSALPWSVVALVWIGERLGRRRADLRRVLADPWQLYIVLWSGAPMLFFTLSGNVLTTYVLPGLPAFALLVAELWQPQERAGKSVRPGLLAAIGGCLAGLLATVVVLIVMHGEFETQRSHKALVAAYEAHRTGGPERLIYVGQR